METSLPLIWGFIIAAAVFLYVVLDGFDLGIGILFPVERGKAERDLMMNTVAPVWDGNQTWLVFGGVGLFAAFPLAYATVLPALYMPLILMLLALIFRGVAFEMRFRVDTDSSQRAWNLAFSGGSYVATFCQGITLGALVQGVRVENRAYAGGWWDWLTPFSIFTGLALIVGYGLLGACWLIWRTEGELQARFRPIARVLGLTLTGFIGAISLSMLFLSEEFREHWLTFPNIILAAPVPVLVIVLAWVLHRSLERRRDFLPFLSAIGLFLLSYIGLAISMWPMIVPPGISIWEAAAPPSTQLFLLVGAAVLIPIILAYTGHAYWVFRGKVTSESGYH
jgi:cytochrome d ubiquinol oxidase subunit II